MMRKVTFFLAVGTALALNSCVSLNPRAAEVPGQQAQSFKRQVSKVCQGHYLVFLPRNYDAKSARRWPLLIFLHGLGERGNNLELVKRHGPPKIVEQKPDFPFVLVSPQCPDGQWWANDVLAALLDEVLEKYNVDRERVYLTGLSMGGFGTWNLALETPERFAAIAPICGGGNPYPPFGYSPARAQALKSLPIWVFHGAKVNTVKLEESERMVKFLTAYGCQVKLTVYPEAGHDSWTETYNNPDLYEWFLQHQRTKTTAK